MFVLFTIFTVFQLSNLLFCISAESSVTLLDLWSFVGGHVFISGTVLKGQTPIG